VAVVVIAPVPVAAAAAALLLGEAAAPVVKPAGRVTPFSAAQVATSRPLGQQYPLIKQNEPDGQG